MVLNPAAAGRVRVKHLRWKRTGYCQREGTVGLQVARGFHLPRGQQKPLVQFRQDWLGMQVGRTYASPPTDIMKAGPHRTELRTAKEGRHTITKFALAVLTLLVGATAWCSNANRPASPDRQTCSYSDQLYESDVNLMRHKAPTHFRLMTSRYVEIVQAARGYNCVGTTTVAFNGHNFIQAGKSDDPGIAQLIPAISSLTGLSLADAFDLTAFAVVSIGIFVGFTGFWYSYPDLRLRWAGVCVFLCLGLLEMKVADVYIFQISPLIAGIPWILAFALKRRSFGLTVSATLLAFCCSWCSLVRSGATLIGLTFLITLLIGSRRVQQVLLPLLLVMLACVPSMTFERYLLSRRDATLASLGETATAVNSHPLWHSVYIGLGFIPNSEVPEYSDAVAIERVRSIDPTAPYTSAKYELILKRELLNLAKRRPWLLIENLAAKTGVVAVLALILLFPARRTLFAEKDVLWLDAAFVLAIGLSTMSAILVIPRPPYLLTFICLTFLYSSMKLCRAFSIDIDQRRALQEKPA
jgi:hypothetical protein